MGGTGCYAHSVTSLGTGPAGTGITDTEKKRPTVVSDLARSPDSGPGDRPGRQGAGDIGPPILAAPACCAAAAFSARRRFILIHSQINISAASAEYVVPSGAGSATTRHPQGLVLKLRLKSKTSNIFRE
jgi:hypothetical protein